MADQAGKIFDENVLTLVWARRYAGYKRADMIASDAERFLKIVKTQIILFRSSGLVNHTLKITVL